MTASSFSLFSQGPWNFLPRFDRDNTHSQVQHWTVMIMIRARGFQVMSNGDRFPAGWISFRKPVLQDLPRTLEATNFEFCCVKKELILDWRVVWTRINKHCWNSIIESCCFEKPSIFRDRVVGLFPVQLNQGRMSLHCRQRVTHFPVNVPCNQFFGDMCTWWNQKWNQKWHETPKIFCLVFRPQECVVWERRSLQILMYLPVFNLDSNHIFSFSLFGL